MTSCKNLLCAWISLTYFVNPCLSAPNGISTISTPASESTPNSNSDVTRTSAISGTSSYLPVEELMEKYQEILYEEGIKVPTDREIRWARRLAMEIVAHERTKKEKHDALKDKTTLEKLARRLVCPTKLRSAIQNFPLLYLPSVEGVRTLQTEIKNQVNTDYNKLYKQLLTALINLQTCWFNKKTDKTECFDNILPELKKLLPQKRQSCNLLTEEQMEIVERFVQLANATSGDDASTVWKDQICLHQDQTIPFVDNETLQYLTFDKMLMNVKKNFDSKKKQEFAVDYIEIERIPRIFGETRFLSEKHNDCKMVLYFSDHGKIKEIRVNLTETFPGIPLHEQVHLHCANYSSLWDVISVIDEHTPGVPTPDNCKPSHDDYLAYIADLIIRGETGLASVVQSLIF